MPANLETTFPAYRIAMSLDHEPGHERDPWNFEIPCGRWKARIYPHGGPRLQAWITTGHLNVALAALAAAGCAEHQVGDHEATVIFDVKDFDRVAAVLRPKLKRLGRPAADMALVRASKTTLKTPNDPEPLHP
jgi:hypothetical protein